MRNLLKKLHSFTYDSITTEAEDLTDLQSHIGMKALEKHSKKGNFCCHSNAQYVFMRK